MEDAAAALTCHVTAPQAWDLCPLCHAQTPQVHSRSARPLAALPWGPYAVRVQLRLRQFCCDNPACPRPLCPERLPTVAAPGARRPRRRARGLLACGIALGGPAGARLAARGPGRPRPDTLLRLGRAAPAPPAPAPQGSGGDEWAGRRGQRYGTILVKLEEQRGLDGLPERAAAPPPPAVRAGVAALHGVCHPALARGGHRQ
jgi:transposase